MLDSTESVLSLSWYKSWTPITRTFTETAQTIKSSLTKWKVLMRTYFWVLCRPEASLTVVSAVFSLSNHSHCYVTAEQHKQLVKKRLFFLAAACQFVVSATTVYNFIVVLQASSPHCVRLPSSFVCCHCCFCPSSWYWFLLWEGKIAAPRSAY